MLMHTYRYGQNESQGEDVLTSVDLEIGNDDDEEEKRKKEKEGTTKDHIA